MNAYLTFRLSENLGTTPEGYLIAKSVPVSRTAERVPLMYKESELGLGSSDAEVRVWRSALELFDRSSMASLEGKVVVSPHPSRFLTMADTAAFAKGHVQHVRPGDDLLDNGERALVADLVIFDPVLAANIRDGTIRDVSLGYATKFVPLENGDWEQVMLRYNHAALVKSGRAGELVAVQDAYGKMSPEQLIRQIEEIHDSVTLKDELDGIRAGSELVETLTRSGCGPGEFAERLKKANPAYASFDAQQQAAKKFEDECRQAGKKMQEQFRPATCVDAAIPIHPQREAESWADAVNAVGRRMRGR